MICVYGKIYQITLVYNIVNFLLGDLCNHLDPQISNYYDMYMGKFVKLH